VQAFAATADRSLFVNAPNTSRNAVLQKLRSDGSVDPAFNADPLPGAVINQVIALADDRVAVVGLIGADLTPSHGYVMVLDGAGRQDPKFGMRTIRDISFPSSIAEADDGTGDIYLGGTFTRYDNQTMQRIARLNSDGSAD
jgi:hypothetical protein